MKSLILLRETIISSLIDAFSIDFAFAFWIFRAQEKRKEKRDVKPKKKRKEKSVRVHCHCVGFCSAQTLTFSKRQKKNELREEETNEKRHKMKIPFFLYSKILCKWLNLKGYERRESKRKKKAKQKLRSSVKCISAIEWWTNADRKRKSDREGRKREKIDGKQKVKRQNECKRFPSFAIVLTVTDDLRRRFQHSHPFFSLRFVRWDFRRCQTSCSNDKWSKIHSKTWIETDVFETITTYAIVIENFGSECFDFRLLEASVSRSLL